MIDKLTPTKAYEVLPFISKRAAKTLRKVVGSVMANARQKGVKEENLYFKEIQINEGPRLKRFRAGARGMAKPYVKKLSHIRIVLGVKEENKVVEKNRSDAKADRKKGNTENTEVIENTEKRKTGNPENAEITQKSKKERKNV